MKKHQVLGMRIINSLANWAVSTVAFMMVAVSMIYLGLAGVNIMVFNLLGDALDSRLPITEYGFLVQAMAAVTVVCLCNFVISLVSEDPKKVASKNSDEG